MHEGARAARLFKLEAWRFRQSWRRRLSAKQRGLRRANCGERLKNFPVAITVKRVAVASWLFRRCNAPRTWSRVCQRLLRPSVRYCERSRSELRTFIREVSLTWELDRGRRRGQHRRFFLRLSE